MITIEALKSLGVDTDKGLAVCMGNEALYLKLVSSVPTEKRFEDLAKAIDEGNLDAAFDAAHALKGVLGNLSLTPLYDKASEITELLRGREEADYKGLMSELIKERDTLADYCK
jgi:HPt (histidine-containing phosphotransfer) domain-containing protein